MSRHATQKPQKPQKPQNSQNKRGVRLQPDYPPLEELAHVPFQCGPLSGTLAPKKLSSAQADIDTPSLGPSAFSRGGACPRMSAHSPVLATPPRKVRAAGTPGVLGEKRLPRATPPRPAGRPVRGHPREVERT